VVSPDIYFAFVFVVEFLSQFVHTYTLRLGGDI
jgi:hypothetical protein